MTSPANQRKLDVVEELAQLADEAGLTLIELAIAFVINHPAVTAAIIGPRTMEQLESQLPAAEITLTADILDRIDQLVAPGRDDQPRRQQLRRSRANPGGATTLLVTVLQTARYVGSLLAGETRGTDDSPGPCPSADTAGRESPRTGGGAAG